jgi:tetratricopeptide (TPR) repeat protein
LDSEAGNYKTAREHYESALKTARSFSHRPYLIKALLARGMFLAKYHKDLTGFQNLSGLEQAFNDLNEALGYCLESGYRIYEADVRVGLAWAYLANGENEKARQSAERAKQMSNEMGYHWGKVDAEEVLKAISG